MKTTNCYGYKYRSGDSGAFERDLDSLKNDYFYAPLISSLNDPFEGRIEREAVDNQFNLISKLVENFNPTVSDSLAVVVSAVEVVFSIVDKCGVFSLSGTPLNELIWAHYGGSHNGFCIEYDIDKLTAFEPSQLNSLDVKYSDLTPSITISDLLLSSNELPVLQKLLGTKSSRWEYESEMRVITTKAGPQQYDFRAVKSIYFGLRCPKTTRNQIMETLSGRGIVYRQVVSNGSTYLLQAEDVIDPFSEAPRYKLGVATIAEGAIFPDYLKPEQKEFSEYLYKAAEIVRREPYCLEIQLVDFSGSKSTPETPVIFVQYKWAENRFINHYLTLHEIDEQYNRLVLEKVY